MQQRAGAKGLGQRAFALNQVNQISFGIFEEDETIAVVAVRLTLKFHSLRPELLVGSIEIID